MKGLRFFSVVMVASGLILASCTKVAELGSKLKAPEDMNGGAMEASEEEGVAELTIIPPPPEPGSEEPLVNVDAEISILGYHDFSSSRRATDMVMHPDKFREQMNSLKQSEIPVISMSDYLAWKKGEASVPSPSVVITIDDGWEGVYTDAFPILKEFGYPFSIYLYQNYIGGAGRSLSYEQIREMIESGCEIGVHSVSHSDMTQRKGRSDAEYDAWLRKELGESYQFLRGHFGDKVLPVFAYPYGKYNQRVMEIAEEFQYELAVTVWGKKASHDAKNLEVGRYIIHGDDDRNYRYAMSFKGAGAVGSGGLASAVSGEEGAAAKVQLWPQDKEVIRDRTPMIMVDVSALGGVYQDSITMEVSGFGRVPVSYDSASGVISHQVVEPLRNESCRVWLKLRRSGQSESDSLSWAFRVDRASLYLGVDEVDSVDQLSNSPGSLGEPSA